MWMKEEKNEYLVQNEGRGRKRRQEIEVENAELVQVYMDFEWNNLLVSSGHDQDSYNLWADGDYLLHWLCLVRVSE